VPHPSTTPEGWLGTYPKSHRTGQEASFTFLTAVPTLRALALSHSAHSGAAGLWVEDGEAKKIQHCAWPWAGAQLICFLPLLPSNPEYSGGSSEDLLEGATQDLFGAGGPSSLCHDYSASATRKQSQTIHPGGHSCVPTDIQFHSPSPFFSPRR
jgi:hypothetical protein